MGLFGSKGSDSKGSNSSTPGFTKELGSVLGNLVSGADQYGKDAAISDVQGVLRTQAESALRDVMPSVFAVDRNQGAYSSSTQQLLRENAEAQIIGQLASTQLDAIKSYAEIEQGNVNAAANATKANTKVSGSSSSSGGGSGLLGLFADGGKVPEVDEPASSASQILSLVKQSFTDPAAVEKSVVSAGIDAASPILDGMGMDAAKMQQSVKSGDTLTSFVDNMILDTVFGFFKDGGTVPEGKSSAEQLRESIQKLNETGKVRTGESDVKAGGKIRGPQTKDGEDNQLIAVGGGEGIIAADVMKVPGVEQLVQRLNEQFHKQ